MIIFRFQKDDDDFDNLRSHKTFKLKHEIVEDLYFQLFYDEQTHLDKFNLSTTTSTFVDKNIPTSKRSNVDPTSINGK